ncbi:hypothetical protein NPIL_214131 [Nephila pilipes]|uniref:Uncharacterized protein n=1 Tax=Nephila pilipes TaxID=299642 RepID=A0A8X6P7C6_NEPPI|nr:hypothetical protein NPIL_214131 [Nephila pilipes]
MKRKSLSIDVSSERVCFNDDGDTKVDSSFSDDAVPLHHFHLGQDIYVAVTYFANAVQIHLRQYGRDDNNRLFPTKRGMIHPASFFNITLHGRVSEFVLVTPYLKQSTDLFPLGFNMIDNISNFTEWWSRNDNERWTPANTT